MSEVELQTMLYTASTAIACSVLGVFLVLRRLAMLTDTMGHVLLFGIAVAYLIVGELDSLWLLVGAVLSCLLTVVLVERLQRTRYLREDAALALVFPALFSIGALLSSLYFRDTHLDVDQVLLGHVEFAESWAALPMLGLAVVNTALVLLFFNVLKLTTFDPTLALLLGLAPTVVHYAMMLLSAVTIVAAFDAVGPILVGAFVVLPALSARLLTDNLRMMLLLSIVFAVLGSVLGVRLAFTLETNTAGMAAVTFGLLFFITSLVAPRRGWLATWLRTRRQRRAWLKLLATQS